MPAPVPETEIVSQWKIACDGGGEMGSEGLGHPRVWLTIPEERGWVECGYCDKRFIHESVENAAAMAKETAIPKPMGTGGVRGSKV